MANWGLVLAPNVFDQVHYAILLSDFLSGLICGDSCCLPPSKVDSPRVLHRAERRAASGTLLKRATVQNEWNDRNQLWQPYCGHNSRGAPGGSAVYSDQYVSLF